MTEHNTPPEPTGEVLLAPAAPPAAAAVFGDRIGVAEHFATILADTGVSHGLIGPREVPIVWERHILNCAVAQEAFPEGVEVVDVGSGAGLPGIALAIARPDLHLHLVEPMLRRTTWLSDTITALGLTNCTVHRGRAEEFHGVISVPWATARAVARIDKLARWTFPLLAQGERWWPSRAAARRTSSRRQRRPCEAGDDCFGGGGVRRGSPGRAYGHADPARASPGRAEEVAQDHVGQALRRRDRHQARDLIRAPFAAPCPRL